MNKFFKGIGFYLVIFIIIVGIVQFSGKPTQKVETLEFSKVYRELTNENISRLYFVSDTAVEGTIKDSNTKFRSYVPKEIMGDTLSKEVLDQARTIYTLVCRTITYFIINILYGNTLVCIYESVSRRRRKSYELW